MSTPIRLLTASLALAALSAGAAHAAPGDSLAVATQKGANYLARDVVRFSEANACMACHRQGAALFGLSTAYAAGYTVDTSPVNGLGFLADRVVADQGLGGLWAHGLSLFSVSKTSYAMLGLAGYDQFVSTAETPALTIAADFALTVQSEDGRWVEDHGQFPTTAGDVGATARIMIALRQAMTRVDAVRAASYAAALDRAAAWLRTVASSTDQAVMGQNFQVSYAILGLEAAGVAPNDPDLVALQARLLGATSRTTQRGWGYSLGNAADEFNTGLALYALCRSGKRLTDDGIGEHAQWLNDRQRNTTVNGGPGGYWAAGAFATRDVPTTFAMLGLGCFGTQGVRVAVVGGDAQQVIAAHDPAPQTRTFTVRVTNTGAFTGSDRYDLVVHGGLPSWSVTVSQPVVTIASGGSVDVTVTVTAPANQPEAVPVTVCVVATSQRTASVTSVAQLAVYTDPAPPTAGIPTYTVITEGNDLHLFNRLLPHPLAASVYQLPGFIPVPGPGAGVVTFFVRGIAIGTDTDADGDGVYRIQWTPGLAFRETSDQDLRAIYSGVDRETDDLLPSYGVGIVHLHLAVDQDDDGLADDVEVAALGLDPTRADTDGDGCLDGVEYYTMGTNPAVVDTDGDGVGDCVEVEQGTDPKRDTSFPDADGDGISDGADPFPCDGDKSAVVYLPGEGDHGTLMFENTWPGKGDLDFNDAVVAYNFALYYNSEGAVSQVVLTLDPLAMGARFDDGLGLHIPVSGTSMASAVRRIGGVGEVLLASEGETDAVIVIADNIRELFADADGFISTEASPAAPLDAPQVTVTITFSPAVAVPVGQEPFDLYFFKSADPTRQVHRPPFTGTQTMNRALFNTADDHSDLSPGGRRFVDEKGLPFVLSMPTLAPWAAEYTDIAQLFPDIVRYATSGGTEARDFYARPDPLKAYPPSLELARGQGVVSPIIPFVPSRACTPVPPGG